MRVLTFLVVPVFALFASVSGALATCQSGEKVIRFGIPKTDTEKKTGRLAKEVQTQFQRALNGRVCVEIVSDAAISVSGTEMEALRENRADIVAASFESLGARASRFLIFGLPFAFPDRLALDRYMAASTADSWDQDLASFGLKGFGLAFFGFEQLGAKKIVFQPSDAVGLKFRQDVGHPSREMLSLMNASGTRIEDKDAAAAVKDGRVEAQFSDWFSLQSSGSATNHTVIMESNFSMPGAQVVGTTLWFETLDEKQRNGVSAAIREGVAQFNRRESQRIAEAKRTVLQTGKPVYVLTRQQRERWKQLFSPLWDVFRSSAGGDLQLKAIEKAGY